MPERMDGWQNAITGVGTAGRDKRLGAGFAADVVTDVQARELWRGDDMAAKIVEDVPREMYRQGFAVKSDDKERSEELSAKLEDLGACSALARAKMYERAYGGAAIMPVLNDGQGDLSQTLNLERIATVQGIHVLEPRELQPVRYYSDPMSPKYGEPEVWRIVPLVKGGASRMVEVHESRLVIWPGIRVSREDPGGVLPGWGDSVLTRVWRILRAFNSVFDSSELLIADFAQAIFKIKGLAEIFATDKDDAFRNRILAADYARSVLRTLVIDAEGEDYERKATPITGLPDMIDRFSTRLAAAARMPVTRLMGISPAGMNATGESDQSNWYDCVAGHQAEDRPMVERLVMLLIRAKDSPWRGKEPDTWSIEFNPLWQQSEEERARARKLQAEIDAAYISSGVLSPEEVALNRFGGDTYSFDTVVDFQARRLLEPEPEAAGDAPGAEPTQNEQEGRA